MDDSQRSKRRRILKQPFDSNFKYEVPKNLKKFRRKKTVKDLVKSDKGQYQCNHCHQLFATEQQLIEHEEVHFETEHVYDCEECGLLFASKISLLSHRRAKHKEKFSSKGLRFKCPECSKTFLQKGGLRTHMTIHTGEKPFKCEVCGVEFRLNSSLQRHLCKEHFSYKPYKCDQCKKEFGHNSDLVHHVRSVHAKERLFVCQICDEKFTTNVVLMRHINIHFELKLNECKVCGAKFSHSGSLYNHMKVHSDERAHQCQTCGKSYKLKSHLKNHSCKVNSKQVFRKDSPVDSSNVANKSGQEIIHIFEIEKGDAPSILRREFQLHVNFPGSVDNL